MVEVSTPFETIVTETNFQRGIESPALFWLGYHLAWTTRRQANVLTDEVAPVIAELIRGAAYINNWELLSLTIKPNLIYMVVRAHPYISPDQIVASVRHAVSLKVLREKFHSFPRMNALWTRAFFATTLQHVSPELLESFLALQPKYERRPLTKGGQLSHLEEEE